MTLGAAVFGEGPLPLNSQNAITVAAASLASVGGQPGVWIVDPATSAVSARPITIAGYETDRVIVAAGLRPGDLVVTRNCQHVVSVPFQVGRQIRCFDAMSSAAVVAEGPDQRRA